MGAKRKVPTWKKWARQKKSGQSPQFAIFNFSAHNFNMPTPDSMKNWNMCMLSSFDSSLIFFLKNFVELATFYYLLLDKTFLRLVRWFLLPCIMVGVLILSPLRPNTFVPWRLFAKVGSDWSPFDFHIFCLYTCFDTFTWAHLICLF